MNKIRKVVYVDHVPSTGRIVLAADIGGTNSNFGVCLLDDATITLLVSYHTPSKEITHFAQLVADIIG